MSLLESVSPTVNVQVALSTYIVGVGIYDEATDEYVRGTITVDGVSYSNVSTKVSSLEEGSHIFNVTPPSGYEFVRWTVHEYTADQTLIRTSTTRPLTQAVTKSIWIWAVLRLALVETALTISAPSRVEPEASINFTGKLTRQDTGEAQSGKTVALEQPPGTTVKSGTTNSSGNYSIAITAPATKGTYTYRASFPGTEGLGRSTSRTLGLGVGAPDPTLITLGAGVLGAIITALGLS